MYGSCAVDTIYTMTTADPAIDRIEVYQNKTPFRRGWRWRYIAWGNNARMGNGGEAYRRSGAALEAAARVCGLPASVDDGWTEVTPPAGAEAAWAVPRNSGLVQVEVRA